MSCKIYHLFVFICIVTIGLSHAAISQGIPFDKLETESAKQLGGKARSVTELWNGYKLECRMQDLQAEVTMNGATIRSTSESEGTGTFSIRAHRIGRETGLKELPNTFDWVNADDAVVRSCHANVVEEYSTSGDGIRQDFVIVSRPGGKGILLLELAVDGAEATCRGSVGSIKIRIASGRELTYHNLQVTDAAGKTLTARFESARGNGVIVTVEDTDAKYPVRIDPTISDADWVSMGGYWGLDGIVNAIATDGSGNVFAGGAFVVAGGVVANHIAKWDGSAWSALGSGTDSAVSSLALDSSGNVYAGGKFIEAGGVVANHIAKWDGSAWNALGNGISTSSAAYTVSALAVDHSGDLYAGGIFDAVDGVAASNIAKWDGSVWTALERGLNRPYVRAIAIDSVGNLYVGGSFDTAGSIAANSIAKWDGNIWTALGTGLSGSSTFALALAIDHFGNLYVGGDFYTAGGISVNHIAKWDGSIWSALGGGTDGSVNALVLDGIGNLYAGGDFHTIGGVGSNNMAKWDGSAWSDKGNGMHVVNALAVDVSGNIYAGEGASGVGASPAGNNIAKWDGSSWSGLGSGTNGGVYSLTVDNSGNLYAIGRFTVIGGTAANGIAKWDGSAWSGFGSGTNGGVSSLTVDNSGNLYAIGEFTVIGGTAANRIAKWDGSSWSALGSGMNNSVSDLALDRSGNLYAIGPFDTAGGIFVNHIAKWDGNTWRALGSGLSGLEDFRASVLAVDNTGNLYAGGNFYTAGGVAAKNIAKWNGSAWSALGSGPNEEVYALALDSSGNLYAGGYFDGFLGTPPDGIAKWDGSSWSSLGSGTNGSVYNITVDNSGNLYIGGWFDSAGGIFVNHIAKWDGSAWSALGSGVSGTEFPFVYALSIDNFGNLYAGGEFSIAGGKVSAYIAQCKRNGLPVKPHRVGIPSRSSITYDTRNSLLRFRLQSATNVAYRIFSFTGREVFRASEFLSKGDHSLRINRARLSQGAYILHFQAGGESMRWRMVVKRKY